MSLSHVTYTPWTHSRTTDPATSKQAATAATFAPNQCEAILALLKAHGQLGAEQVADKLGMESYAARKRLADLFNAGLAEPVNFVTRKTRSGRNERVWRAK